MLFQTIGEGNSKKVAKKHAAENMLNELKKLPPIRSVSETQGNGRRKNFTGKRNASSNSRQQVQQISSRRKGSTTMVKEVNNTSALSAETTTDENELGNPIAMLLRVQQVGKHPEPIYNVIEERGQGRRKEFVMEVNCSGLTARGIGSSKKLAKREAANNILNQMGYSSETGNLDVATGQNANNTDKGRKVTFSEARVYSENNGQSVGGAAGRQLVPGLLLMKSPENNRSKYHTLLSFFFEELFFFFLLIIQ